MMLMSDRITDIKPLAQTGDAEPCRSVGAEARCTGQGPALDHVFRGREVLTRWPWGRWCVSFFVTLQLSYYNF